MTTFRAMTWNDENLFMPKTGASLEVQTQYAFKLNLIANVSLSLMTDSLSGQVDLCSHHPCKAMCE